MSSVIFQMEIFDKTVIFISKLVPVSYVTHLSTATCCRFTNPHIRIFHLDWIECHGGQYS